MFAELIAAYLPYQESKKDPGNYPDTVQGLGMRFCDVWKAHKDALEAHFGEEPEYSKYNKWMPTLIT